MSAFDDLKKMRKYRFDEEDNNENEFYENPESDNNDYKTSYEDVTEHLTKIKYDFLQEEERQKLLMLSIEWVDLPCFLFYNFGFFLFCFAGFSWISFPVIGLSLWIARFLWSNKLKNAEFVNVNTILFLHKIPPISNFLIVGLILDSIVNKNYFYALFLLLWKIPFSVFMQYITPVEKPSINDYAFLIYKTMFKEEMKKYKNG